MADTHEGDPRTGHPGDGMAPAGLAMPLWADVPATVDLLGFTDIAEPVVEGVLRDNLDPVAIGILGDWGSGKSTVLELVGQTLRRESSVLVVPTQPWEYDPSLDVRATLIAEVLAVVGDHARADEGRWKKLGGRLNALAKRVEWSKAITLATKSAMTFSLPSIESVVEVFSGAGGQAAEDPTLQGFREQFAALMADLEEIHRVVVLVDDLDRCLPETVIATLETIKLFLSVPKMAFVVAADSRLVELSIAERFERSPQATRMAQDYLEKILQIPVAVPTLGRSDTEAYLGLLALEPHLRAAGQSLEPVAEHCQSRRRRAEARIFDELPDGLIPDAARRDLESAARLAGVLYHRLDGNPRRLKRFLNAFWIRSRIARRRGVALEDAALAKLMVLERIEPDAFAIVLDWLGRGVLVGQLQALEAGDVPPLECHPAMEWWARMQPALAALDLEPYLRLAAALQNRTPATSRLPAALQEVLDGLQSATLVERTRAGQRLDSLAPSDRTVVAREIVETLRLDPNAQEYLSSAVQKLVQDPQHAPVVIEALHKMDPVRVQAGLIASLQGAESNNPDLFRLLRQWLDSGELGEVAELAARELLSAG